MAKTLIAAQAAAATGRFTINSHHDLPCTVIGHGMGVGDTADIQVSYDGGSTWEDYYYDGAKIGLAYQSQNAVGIYSPGVYRIDKPGATAATFGVVLSTIRNP